MSGFLLDTSALLTLRDNEPGAARVSQLLREASDNGSPCCGCFMSLTPGRMVFSAVICSLRGSRRRNLARCYRPCRHIAPPPARGRGWGEGARHRHLGDRARGSLTLGGGSARGKPAQALVEAAS
jgi:hypothetical protein